MMKSSADVLSKLEWLGVWFLAERKPLESISACRKYQILLILRNFNRWNKAIIRKFVLIANCHSTRKNVTPSILPLFKRYESVDIWSFANSAKSWKLITRSTFHRLYSSSNIAHHDRGLHVWCGLYPKGASHYQRAQTYASQVGSNFGGGKWKSSSYRMICGRHCSQFATQGKARTWKLAVGRFFRRNDSRRNAACFELAYRSVPRD